MYNLSTFPPFHFYLPSFTLSVTSSVWIDRAKVSSLLLSRAACCLITAIRESHSFSSSFCHQGRSQLIKNIYRQVGRRKAGEKAKELLRQIRMREETDRNVIDEDEILGFGEWLGKKAPLLTVSRVCVFFFLVFFITLIHQALISGFKKKMSIRIR